MQGDEQDLASRLPDGKFLALNEAHPVGELQPDHAQLIELHYIAGLDVSPAPADCTRGYAEFWPKETLQ